LSAFVLANPQSHAAAVVEEAQNVADAIEAGLMPPPIPEPAAGIAQTSALPEGREVVQPPPIPGEAEISPPAPAVSDLPRTTAGITVPGEVAAQITETIDILGGDRKAGFRAIIENGVDSATPESKVTLEIAYQLGAFALQDDATLSDLRDLSVQMTNEADAAAELDLTSPTFPADSLAAQVLGIKAQVADEAVQFADAVLRGDENSARDFTEKILAGELSLDYDVLQQILTALNRAAMEVLTDDVDTTTGEDITGEDQPDVDSAADRKARETATAAAVLSAAISETSLDAVTAEIETQPIVFKAGQRVRVRKTASSTKDHSAQIVQLLDESTIRVSIAGETGTRDLPRAQVILPRAVAERRRQEALLKVFSKEQRKQIRAASKTFDDTLRGSLTIDIAAWEAQGRNARETAVLQGQALQAAREEAFRQLGEEDSDFRSPIERARLLPALQELVVQQYADAEGSDEAQRQEDSTQVADGEPLGDSDLSEDQAQRRRLFGDAKRRYGPGSNAGPGLERAFAEVEYSAEFEATAEFEGIAALARSYGMTVVPVANFAADAWVDPTLRVILLDHNPSTGSPEQQVRHEIFHFILNNGDPRALQIVSNVKAESIAFRKYAQSLNDGRIRVGVEPLDITANADLIAREVSADLFGELLSTQGVALQEMYGDDLDATEDLAIQILAADMTAFSLRSGEFELESVTSDQLEAEETAAAEREAIQKGAARQLTGTAGDLTGDLFDARAAEAPLFAQKPTRASDDTASLFSTRRPVGDIDALGYHSALERAVLRFPQPKSSPQQFMAWLKKQPGVKPEEMEWTDLESFMAGKKSVTKEEVAEHLEQNQVEVQELVAGAGTIDPDSQEELDDARASFRAAHDARAQASVTLLGLLEAGGASQVDRINIVRGIGNRSSAAFDKSVQYLPESYDINEYPDANEAAAEAEIDLDEAVNSILGVSTKYEQYTLPGGENYREVLLTLPAQEGDAPPFSSAHWDEKNVLAHFRVKDRVDQQGRKLLTIEEIQSDWHQAGRRKGYGRDAEAKRLATLKENVAEAQDQMRALEQAHAIPIDSVEQLIAFRESNRTYDRIATQSRDWQKEIVDIQSKRGAVPNAPFKKSWLDLALKRIATMAAEGGYDGIAWTTGQQQAERYDLSKQVSRVSYTPKSQVLRAFNLDGESVISEKLTSDAALADYIGKAAADKLLAAPTQRRGAEGMTVSEAELQWIGTTPDGKTKAVGKGVVDGREQATEYLRRQFKIEAIETPEGTSEFQELTGIDLKVGGEGMKSFYDQFLPKAALRLGKKTGATVGRVNVGTGQGSTGPELMPLHFMPITDKMRTLVSNEGLPLFSVRKSEETIPVTEGPVPPLASLSVSRPAASEPEKERRRRERAVLRPKPPKTQEQREKKIIEVERAFTAEELNQQRKQFEGAIREQRTDIFEKQRLVRQYIDSTLPVDIRGRANAKIDTIARFAKQETRDKYAERAIKIIDEMAARAATNALRKKARETLRKELVRIRKATAKGKTRQDVTANRKMRDLIESVTAVQEAKADDLRKSMAWFSQHPEEEMPARLVEEIENSMKPNINIMTQKELRDLLADIESIKRFGKLKFELKQAKEKREQEQLADESIAELGRPEELTDAQRLEKTAGASVPRGFARKFGNLAKLYGWAHIRPERMIDWFSKFKKGSTFKAQTFDKLLSAENSKLQNTEKTLQTFEKVHAGINIAEAQNKPLITIGLIEEAEEGKAPKVRKITLTLDQAMFVYANSQNSGNLAHLIGSGFNAEVIEDVIDKIPQEAIDAVDAMIDFYDDKQYDRMSDVFAREHGVDMPKEERYFPIKNLDIKRAENVVMSDLLARMMARHPSLKKGMTRSRIHSNAAFQRMSYFESVVENLLESEHYIAYNDAVREVSRFLNRQDVRAAMDERSEEATRQTNDWVKAVAFGKIRSTGNTIDRVSDFLRSNYVTSVLGFNLITTLKQPASFAQGLRFLDTPSDGIEASARFLQNPRAMLDFVREKSTAMRNRSNSVEREMAELLEKNATKRILGAQTDIQQFKDQSLKMIQWADGITTTILWDAKYRAALSRGLGETEAVQEADELIRKTQPAGGLLHIPAVMRAGGIARAYTMFTNQLNQNANLIFETGANFKGIPKTVLDFIMIILVPSLLIHMASTGGRAISDLIRFGKLTDPEREGKELARAMVGQVTGGFAVFNRTADAAMKRLTGDKGGLFLLDLTPSSLDAIDDLNRAIVLADGEKALSGILKLFGIPYAQFRRTYRGVDRFKDTKDPRALIWSGRALGEKRRSFPRSSSKKKTSEKRKLR